LRGLLLYAYVLSAGAAALSRLAALSPWLAGALVCLFGVVNAASFLGCAEHARRGMPSRDGRIALALTILGIVWLVGLSIHDRNLARLEPVVSSKRGALLLLGGVDSTSGSGALVDLDPRVLGFPPAASKLLSYRGPGEPYRAVDTHADLAGVARRVAQQLQGVGRPRDLLGHSQAAVIVDHILGEGLSAPDASAVISPAPRLPPPVGVPEPGHDGRGRVGGDVARALSGGLAFVGFASLHLDAPASPTNLSPVPPASGPSRRLALWALGDSVLLDTDWRRPGERNVVVLSDHVGAVLNARALDAAARWFQRRPVESDESSWRSWLVDVYRYAFEPWRP
jgi:hypothetical protein